MEGPEPATTLDHTSNASHMRFSLLSKRGNKQQTHDIQVPLDAKLAIHSRQAEERQRLERQQLKQLVLGMDAVQSAKQKDHDSFEERFSRRGQGLRGKFNEIPQDLP